MTVNNILDSNLFDADYAQHDARLRELVTIEYAEKLYDQNNK